MTNSSSITKTKTVIVDSCCFYPSNFCNINHNHRKKRKLCDMTMTTLVNEPTCPTNDNDNFMTNSMISIVLTTLQDICSNSRYYYVPVTMYCYDQLSYYVSIIQKQLLFLPIVQITKIRQADMMYIDLMETLSIQKNISHNTRICRRKMNLFGTRHSLSSYVCILYVIAFVILFVPCDPVISSDNKVYSFQYPIVTKTTNTNTNTVRLKSGRCKNSILVSPMTLSSLSLSSNSNNNDVNYDDYTVKELRQLVKDLPSLERGTLSKLTKKHDLISYLMNIVNVNSNSSINTSSVLLSSTTFEEQEEKVVVVQQVQRRQKTVTVNEQIEVNPRKISTRPGTTTTTTGSKAMTSTSTSPMSRMAPIMIQQQQRQTTMSAKDTIIEEVLTRYPPIREHYTIKLQNKQQQQQQDDVAAEECVVNENDDDNDECVANSAVLSTVDVRQQYHPIFRKLVTTTTGSSTTNTASTSSNPIVLQDKEEQEDIETDTTATTTSTSTAKVSSSSSSSLSSTMFTSSDMDLIFVGTASCTPGITRGTSCTALRLNWQQRTGTTSKQQQRLIPPPTSNIIRNGKTQQVQQNVQSYTTNSVTAGTWLFDVGECTQLQIQRTTSIKPSKITKIFLTHAHGDHSFGLPGLLCVMGNGNQNRDLNMQNNNNNNGEQQQPIEIYGPEGLRMWLRVAIRYSVSRIVPQYVVHELMDLPMAPEWEFNRRFKRYYYNGFQQQQQHSSNHNNNNVRSPLKGPWGLKGLAGEDPTNWISQAKELQLDPSPLYGEDDGGRSIYPDYNHPKANDGAPVWTLIQDETVTVSAVPMSHTIPCVGYCIEEAERPGRLRNEVVEPIVQRNLELLRTAGLKNPMKVMGILKNLKPDTVFTFPDGTVVTQTDAVEAARKGRKVVICGDTCDSRAMIKLGQDADVVVHEATNSYLPGVDTKRDITYNDVTRDCIIHGHSTPQMAGEFCKKINGKQLLLNHFSARYKGDVSAESLSIMMRIERLAIQTSGLDETNVAAAWDFMILPIQQRE